MNDPLLTSLIQWQATHAPQTSRWVVAYSGGVDSHVLLHVCHRLAQQAGTSLKLRAIHINHQLHQQSSEWVSHCQQVAHDLGIELQVVTVSSSPRSGESVEAWAREQRYQCIAQSLQPNEIVLTAQTLDDQAETLLMNVLRGSGIRGLSCMPVKKTLGAHELHRPWLECSRASIEFYAQQHQLTWVEDPSNQDSKYLRNFIRHELLPIIKTKIPGITQALVRTCSHNQEALHLLEEVAQTDAFEVLDQHNRIMTEPLSQLPRHRQKNLLRYWIAKQRHPLPPEARLHTLLEQLHAKEDKQPSIQWQSSTIKRFKKRWSLHKTCVQQPYAIPWRGEQEVSLPNGKIIQVTHKLGQGMLIPPDAKVMLASPNGPLQAKPHRRNVTKPLKKWWQEYSVPPWERTQWPLVFINQELAMIPGLFVTQGWQASEHEVGVCFEFK